MIRLLRGFWVQLAIVLILTIAAAGFDAGTYGLAASEGHRVVPGVEFLERWTEDRAITLADVLVPTMFDTPYLRKPPGMPWAIAVSLWLGGPTEGAARMVSTVSIALMATLGAWCGRRWWDRLSQRDGGARFSFGALTCGLAVGLLPTALSSARAAEIETLHNLWIMICSVIVVELLYIARVEGASRLRRWLLAAGLAFSLVGMILVKGPAGVPVVAGLIGGCAIASRSWRTLIDGALWVGIGAASVLVGLWAWLTAQAVRTLEGVVVTQGVDAFLFEPDRLMEVAMLPLAAVGYQLPAAFGVLFAISPRSRVDMTERERPSVWLARALAWGWVIGVLIYTLSGVSNPRYVLPAASVAGLASGFVVRGVVARTFIGPRMLLGRIALFGTPIVTGVVLVAFAVGYVLVEHPRRGASSGREAGATLAEVLVQMDGPIEVWADGAIEARPEVLWEVERQARLKGVQIEGRWAAEWKDDLSMPESEPGMTRVVLLRDDAGGNERAAAEQAGLLENWDERWQGEAAQFRFWLGVPAASAGE